MDSQKPSRLSTVCAVILAISYVVIGASYLLLPAEQRGGTLLHDPEKFLISMSRSPALITVHHLAFALGALVGLAVILGVLDLAKTFNPDWVRWLSGLGAFGFAVTAVDNFKIIAAEPIRAARYMGGEAAVKAIMRETDYLVSVDPQMWLGYGLVGLWVLGASWILMKKWRVPLAFGLLGIGVGLGYLLVEVGTVLRSEEWLTASAIAAIIAAPTWYIWLALILQKKRTVGLGSFS